MVARSNPAAMSSVGCTLESGGDVIRVVGIRAERDETPTLLPVPAQEGFGRERLVKALSVRGRVHFKQSSTSYDIGKDLSDSLLMCFDVDVHTLHMGVSTDQVEMGKTVEIASSGYLQKAAKVFLHQSLHILPAIVVQLEVYIIDLVV